MTLIGAAALVAAMAGCDLSQAPSADAQQAQQTKQLTAEALRQIGMPNIVNFQERKLMKQILELRDKEDLVCYAYIVNLNGELIYLGKCIGFGLPYSVQFTNPQRIADSGHSYGYAILPQPDPNGLFMPEGLSATWLMMLDPASGEVRPVYVEPEIIVSPFPLK